jgi:hypothetical protein
MDQEQLLSRLVETLERLRIPYAIGGSHATMAFGQPRHTLDIDVVVELTTLTLRQLISEFPFPDYYTSEEGARTAVAHGGTFNIIHPESGQKIDFFVPSDEFERAEIPRAVRAPTTGGREASFVSPEDVIVMKMRYFEMGESDKHLRDSATVLQRLGEKIDRAYIERRVAEFGLHEIWQAVLQRSNG